MKEFFDLTKGVVFGLVILWSYITLILWSSIKVEVWYNGEKRYGNWGRRITLVEVLEVQKEWIKGYKIK